MADSEKGVSTLNPKKKGPLVDEDFGKDFLSSWKSSKLGNDEIDFDMETIPKNKKKSFDFGKLDDFELRGDFGKKISSFKMDMPDLDFSSPVKKTDKSSKEPVPGKQESRQEKFSFNFDFNELGRFDLDSSPQEGERNPSKISSGTLDRSLEHNSKQQARSNSATSSDLFKGQETKKSQDTDSMVTSRPDNLIGPSNSEGSRVSTSDLEPNGVSHDGQTSVMQQITITEQMQNGNSSSEKYRSKDSHLTKQFAHESTQALPLQTVLGESSAQEDSSQIRTGIAYLDAVKLASAKEQDNCIRSVDSSQSRSSNPANSIDSRSSQKPVAIELSDTTGFDKNFQGDPNEITGVKQALSELNPGQKNAEDASPSVFLRNTVLRMNNASDRKNSGLKLIQSSLQRDSSTIKPTPVKEKATSTQQFQSVKKLAGNASPTTSSFAQKQLAYIHDSKIKVGKLCPGNEDREPKENQNQAEKQKVAILKSYEEDTTKGLKVISGSERNHVSSDTSSFQLKAACLPQQTIVSEAAKNIIPNLVSSLASVKSSKIVPVEMSANLKDDKASNISRLSISRITKLNSKPQNSANLGEAKSLSFCEKKLELPPSIASSMVNPIVKERAPSSTSLKRKTSEESIRDPDTINALKHIMKSPRRTPFEFSPKFHREMVTKASASEITETCHSDSSPRYLTSNGPPKFGIETDVEVPKDGKACDISRLTISSRSPSSATPGEAKAKAITDARTVSPFKCAMPSATRRKPFKISPRTKNTMIPSTENREACHSDNCAEDLISNGTPEFGSLTHVEIPVLIEKDGNVEKAETWTKELDEMCNMLRKQHEEAKDLMVRALVTNNQLLMLNHPILEEKINALQRFANSLRSKEFF